MGRGGRGVQVSRDEAELSLMGYLSHRMKEPATLDELKALGLSYIGQDLEGKPSKKEEKLSMELAIKQGEIDELRQRLNRRRSKRKKRSKPKQSK